MAGLTGVLPRTLLAAAVYTYSMANLLAEAASAYLRTAAHQPVAWRQWDTAAFQEAQRQDKPILLDIGAVWCHWCHVMDRESYEDAATAALINQHFIAVKVDRDERPDIDSRYQAAISALTGQGGWPLTAFLTPDGKPFYGGTYFPPTEQYGRPSFRRVLESVARAYVEQHQQVRESGERLLEVLARGDGAPAAPVTERLVTAILDSAQQMFDPRHGGFGSAPKFPHPGILDLVLDRLGRQPDPVLLNLATTTLDGMARGGVYDQLAGGFHRYSVDERWCVPHFEKMAYDNSELLRNYVHAFQVTGEVRYRAVALDIVRWVDDWLTDRESGGFYSSQDADISLDDDGDYFTWTVEEARAVLTAEEFEAAAVQYDIEPHGEMHHNPAKNVLWVKADDAEVARVLGWDESAAQARLAEARTKLAAARRLRPTPFIDRTLYAGWNGMFVSAYLAAAQGLGPPDQASAACRTFALRTLDRMLRELRPGVGVPHVLGTAVPGVGFLDDQVFTGLACLDAFGATSDSRYFEAARQLAELCLAAYWDEAGEAFFDTRRDSHGGAVGALAMPRKHWQDSPTPSGNAAAVILLERLYGLTHEPAFHAHAGAALAAFAGQAEQYGIFAATYGLAAQLYLNGPELVLILEGNDGTPGDHLAHAARRHYRAGRTVLKVSGREVGLPAAVAETLAQLPAHDAAQALVCSGFTCQAPVSDAPRLLALLGAK